MEARGARVCEKRKEGSTSGEGAGLPVRVNPRLPSPVAPLLLKRPERRQPHEPSDGAGDPGGHGGVLWVDGMGDTERESFERETPLE